MVFLRGDYPPPHLGQLEQGDFEHPSMGVMPYKPTRKISTLYHIRLLVKRAEGRLQWASTAQTFIFVSPFQT